MDLFPFKTIRPGQKEFLNDCRIAVKKKKHLIAHAPTGIGKTAAVLSAALEYAIPKGKTIFFLTPKHTQHIIVIDTLKRIKKKKKDNNPDFTSVDFIGKQWVCPYPKTKEISSKEFNEFCRANKRDERCTYYSNVHKKKSFGKVNELVEKIGNKTMHAEEVKDIAKKGMFCPYEICIKAGKMADIIICDYFHLFSPKVRKAFLLRLDKKLEDSILIIDEAHNLPERVRKILSYSLTEVSLKRAKKEANFLGYNEIGDYFEDIEKVIKKIAKENMKHGEQEIYARRDEFMNKVKKETDILYDDLCDMINDLGEEVLKIPKRYRSYSKSIARFLRNWSYDDKRYARILTRKSNGNFTILSYKCMDPGVSTKDIFSEAHSTIFMSGTLIPLDMYEKTLDLEGDRTILREYESPFPKENQLLLLVPGVTTQFKKRSELMYQNYAKKISKIVKKIPRNIALFFPSYSIMNSIVNNLRNENLNGKKILIEEQGMEKEQRIALYNRLVKFMNKENKGGGILAGVMAGSLSEGVDYPENLLDSVMIVGLPLKIPNLEVKSLINYYDFRFNRGWDYGYIYPAMNRALQAAGRCIRSEEDRGAIILMDERFRWQNYSKCFPKDYQVIVSEIPEKYLDKFYS